jgi:hypothetical protein
MRNSPPLRLPLLALSVVVFAVSPQSVSPQLGNEGEKVTVRGAATTAAGLPAASERALQQAFRLAVEQVSGVIVESETLVRNLALFEDNILTKTEGYVRDFEILFQEESEGILTLEVEVEVVPGRLSRDLQSIGILLRRANFPLVSVEMFTSSTVDLPPDTDARLEGEVRAMLKDRGLEVVEPNGRGLDAVVRIEGTLELSNAGDPAGTGLQTANASVSLQAIETSTGTIMAATRGRSRGAGISAADARDRASIRSVEDSLEELMDGLIEEWSSRANNRDAVMLSIRGIDAYAQVSWLSGVLTDDFGETENVVERQVNIDRGTAFLEWRGRSNSRSLAQWLSAAEFAEYQVVVVGTSGNMVQLEIRVPQGDAPGSSIRPSGA